MFGKLRREKSQDARTPIEFEKRKSDSYEDINQNRNCSSHAGSDMQRI